MGSLQAFVYSPLLIGAGSNYVSCNIYAHWNEDDIELINATPNSFQSGETKELMLPSTLIDPRARSVSNELVHAALVHAKNQRRILSLEKELLQLPNGKAGIEHARHAFFQALSALEKQSGHTKHVVHKSTLPAEKEKKSSSISASLDVAADVAEISTHVPILSDFAGPAAWALRCTARLASAFGFSRPVIDEKPRIVNQNDYPYNSNVEGPDVSMPLSLTIEPTLRLEPKLGAKVEDEMAIDSFVTKFGYHTTINIPTSAVAGQNLWNRPLGVFYSTSNEGFYPKPYQMLAKMFKYWRGNFRFRIKFVKTKMHTARLMFAFFPGVLATQTLSQAEYVHREIVDISTIDELVYELPFTSAYPYLTSDLTTVYGTYGSFQVFVVNPLIAPSSVSGSINLIIETAMGEGSEWFQPNSVIDIIPTLPTSFLRAESGETQSLTKVSTLCDAVPTGPQVETAQLCVGEKLMSLRQMIKYPGSMNCTPNVLSFFGTGGGMGPYYFNPFGAGGTTAAGGNTTSYRDFLGLLMPYFRFSRGGMRVRALLSTSDWMYTEAGYTAWCTDDLKNGACGLDTSSGASTPFGSNFDVKLETVCKFLLPSWQCVPIVPHKYLLSDQASLGTLLYRQSSLYLYIANSFDEITYHLAFQRQPADDYELMTFVGPPLFTLATISASSATGLRAKLKEAAQTPSLVRESTPNKAMRALSLPRA
jgi:hypothetical protein